MKTPTVLALLLLLNFAAASVAEAADPPALVVTKGGYYYLVTDDAGDPTLVKVTHVVVIGDPPPGGGDTDPPPASGVAAQVRVWAAEVGDPVGAQALALVYTTVADKLDKGEVKPEDAFAAVKDATDETLGAVQSKAKWDGFRARLGEVIVAKLQGGELQHPKDTIKLLRDVAAGLTDSKGEAAALDRRLIEQLVALILKILLDKYGDDIGVGGPV